MFGEEAFKNVLNYSKPEIAWLHMNSYDKVKITTEHDHFNEADSCCL